MLGLTNNLRDNSVDLNIKNKAKAYINYKSVAKKLIKNKCIAESN